MRSRIVSLMLPVLACGEPGATEDSGETGTTTSETGSTSDSSSSSDGTDETGDTAACNDDEWACPSGCCACPVPGEVSAIDLGVVVRLAAAGDLDGDERLDLVVTTDSGFATFQAMGCGGLSLAGEGTVGSDWTGLAVADLVDGGGVEVVAFDPLRELGALQGFALEPLWSGSMTMLASAGAVQPAHLDTDADHDVAVFDATFGQLLRVENTGSGWTVRTSVTLPAGIDRVNAGDLGANGRDEILFLGGGLVEVISVADFDYSNVQPLSGAPHGPAAPDAATRTALIAAGSVVERWVGDPNTALASQMGSIDVGATIVAAATDPGTGAVVLDDQGGLHRIDAAGPTELDGMPLPGPAEHVFAGDIDGDGNADALAVAADGTAYVAIWP